MSTLIQFFTINGPTIVLATAIALLLASIWTWSRHRLMTSFLSLTGAFLLAGVWHLSFSEERVEDLKAQLRLAKIQETDLREDMSVEKARTEDVRDEFAATMKVHSDQLGRLHTRVDQAVRSVDPLIRPAKDGIDWSAMAKVSREGNNRRFTATRRRVELLEREIAALKARYEVAKEAPGPVSVQAVRQPGLKPELKQLRNQLAYGIETDEYEVQVMPDNEVIRGQKGKYYVIDLKDAANGLKFRFPGGKYTLARSDASFRKSLNKFVGNVAGKLEDNVRFGFFVRGSADSVPFRGRLLEDYKYNKVAYLRSVGDGRYRLGPTVRPIKTSIRNGDLPFLRAQFLKDVVATTYPVSEPVVLEGSITDRKNNEDRNVELILYVDW